MSKSESVEPLEHEDTPNGPTVLQQDEKYPSINEQSSNLNTSHRSSILPQTDKHTSPQEEFGENHSSTVYQQRTSLAHKTREPLSPPHATSKGPPPIPSRSRGPTILEQVISKTRPSHLPPKTKAEELKHLADWESMMRQSRVIEESRRAAMTEQRAIKEAQVKAQIPQWEKEILPDWRIVNKSSKLRKLWWQGMPPKLRPNLWPQVIGNQLALSKGSYKACLARAKRSISSGSYPENLLRTIEKDIESTLPSLKLFLSTTGPLYSDLRDILLAWTTSRSDEGLAPFVPGVSRLVGMFLINLSSNEQVFVTCRNFLERSCPRAFCGGLERNDEREAYYREILILKVFINLSNHCNRIFDTLLADFMPKVYFNFKQHQISPAVYLPDWFTPCFLDHLPFETSARIWDIAILEGDTFLFRVAIAILAVIASRLYFPDRTELLEVLRGEHHAAVEVARRLDPDVDSGKYSIYGVNEENLWKCIEEVEIWWKDSTWDRLVQRELPDI